MTYQPAPPLPRSARHADPDPFPAGFRMPAPASAEAPAEGSLFGRRRARATLAGVTPPAVPSDDPFGAAPGPVPAALPAWLPAGFPAPMAAGFPAPLSGDFPAPLSGDFPAPMPADLPTPVAAAPPGPRACDPAPATAADTQPIRLRVRADVPRPDPACVELARRSFWLLGDIDLLSQRFDARLLCLTARAEEALRRYFPRNGERFVTALLRPVEALGAEHEPVPSLEAEVQLRQLGARLYAVGMHGEDFGFIGLSLVRAIRDSYPEEWSTKLGSAWSEVHNWLVALLEAGARAARLVDTERSLGARVLHVEAGRTASFAG